MVLSIATIVYLEATVTHAMESFFYDFNTSDASRSYDGGFVRLVRRPSSCP